MSLLHAGFLLQLVVAVTPSDTGAIVPDQIRTGSQIVQSPTVLVIAHRGDSRHAPENTLPAFQRAVQTGADLVELDYYHSSDGIPVVLHDDTLERTTNAESILGRNRLSLEKNTLADLRRLDAGAWFHARYRGTQIPTLSESLDVIQNGSLTLIERKGGDAATCVQLLREKKLLDRVVVQAFDWDYLRDCHHLAPTLALGALGSKSLTKDKLDQLELTGCQVVGWNHRDLRTQDIVEIHRRGLRAWVYTVDDSARARELIAAGIDGIITNDPAMLREIVGRD